MFSYLWSFYKADIRIVSYAPDSDFLIVIIIEKVEHTLEEVSSFRTSEDASLLSRVS
jgi:hypothetical protein